MSEITAYPLAWPSWLPRPRPADRTRARFGKRGWGVDQVTVAERTRRILAQISAYTRSGRTNRAAPDDVVISTNMKVRLDRLPRSGQRAPEDPGVAVYFKLDGKSRCIPCDCYDRIADNLAAVAATLEALRTVERHGSNIFEAAFTGFTALPGPGSTPWRDVLGYHGNDLVAAKQAYRTAARRSHPDAGGNAEQFHQVQQAWEQALDQLGVHCLSQQLGHTQP